MRMTAIQMKAVRKSKRRIVVLGRTKAWSPPRRRVRINEQAREAGKPVKSNEVIRAIDILELLAIHE